MRVAYVENKIGGTISTSGLCRAASEFITRTRVGLGFDRLHQPHCST
jgi:hypothetical protein